MSRLHLAPPSRKDGYFLEPRRGGAVFLLSCVCEIEKSVLARVLGIGAGWRGATETRLSVRCSVRAALRRYGACLARDGCTLPRMSVVCVGSLSGCDSNSRTGDRRKGFKIEGLRQSASAPMEGDLLECSIVPEYGHRLAIYPRFQPIQTLEERDLDVGCPFANVGIAAK